MDVAVQRLDERGPLQRLVMIVFTDVTAPLAAKPVGRPPKPPALSPRLAELELMPFKIVPAHRRNGTHAADGKRILR